MHDMSLVQSKHLSDNPIIQKTLFSSIQKFVMKIVANWIIKKYTYYDITLYAWKVEFPMTCDKSITYISNFFISDVSVRYFTFIISLLNSENEFFWPNCSLPSSPLTYVLPDLEQTLHLPPRIQPPVLTEVRGQYQCGRRF